MLFLEARRARRSEESGRDIRISISVVEEGWHRPCLYRTTGGGGGWIELERKQYRRWLRRCRYLSYSPETNGLSEGAPNEGPWKDWRVVLVVEEEQDEEEAVVVVVVVVVTPTKRVVGIRPNLAAFLIERGRGTPGRRKGIGGGRGKTGVLKDEVG